MVNLLVNFNQVQKRLALNYVTGTAANASYLSPSIQNELLIVAVDIVRKEIQTRNLAGRLLGSDCRRDNGWICKNESN